MSCCLLDCGRDLRPCLDYECKITIKISTLQEGTFRSYGYLLVGIGCPQTSPKTTLTRINFMAIVRNYPTAGAVPCAGPKEMFDRFSIIRMYNECMD